MSQLIIQLVFALLAFYYATSVCHKLEDKIWSVLKRLDDINSCDPGYFSESQRYYDSRKLLVISYLIALSVSVIVMILIKDIYSLLIS